MKCCAIMQPTYLPWLGYFAMIRAVDVFVMLDDVQFARRSWQCQNRIQTQGKEVLLRVPVCRQPRDTRIDEIRVNYQSTWPASHMLEISQAYLECSGNTVAIDFLQELFATQPALLADLNIAFIRHTVKILDISTPILRASELACPGRRSEHLALVCKAVGAEEYVAAQGSRDYLIEDRFQQTSGLKLSFFDFLPQPYSQPGSQTFISHLSILDVLANCGLEETRMQLKQWEMTDG